MPEVCKHDGISIAVLIRGEHCPPHVHAGADDWDARFTFSFWHNDVFLWDVTPRQATPAASRLEAIRQAVKLPANLRKAREEWWRCLQTVCLVNQRWDPVGQEVVSSKSRKTGLRIVRAARFQSSSYRTRLELDGNKPNEVEIEL